MAGAGRESRNGVLRVKIILASQSPRRRELLERMGITEFEVVPAQGEETVAHTLPPDQLVEELSRRKCAEVAAAHPEALVIAADTLVAVNNRVLGKPSSEADAARMLAALSGRQHMVYTGITVFCGGERATEHEMTCVRFRTLSEADIVRYIATGEPMDKAGAYGIQGYGSMLVEGISGDYYNVMGLPVCRLGKLLIRFGVDPLALAVEKEQAK